MLAIRLVNTLQISHKEWRELRRHGISGSMLCTSAGSWRMLLRKNSAEEQAIKPSGTEFPGMIPYLKGNKIRWTT